MDFFNNQTSQISCGLYVVATPIGNLADITLHALNVLKNVDFIVCEDSRITQNLLKHYQIFDKKFIVYNDHSDEKIRLKILNFLLTNKSLALVSDAGTPLISDPGYKLINFLRSNNQKIIPIAGASSLTASLSVAGLACDQFMFLGFLPTSNNHKQNIFKNYSRNFTWVCFESANRLLETLNLLKECKIDSRICVAREITKIYEQIIVDQIDKLIEYFAVNQDKIRGEVVLIIEKNLKNHQDFSIEELQEAIISQLKLNKSLKDIASELAEIFNINKKTVYKLALEITQSVNK